MPDIEKLIDASRPAAWARHRRRIPPSYQTKVTREAFEAGFEAGLEFARIAVEQEGESDGQDTGR